MLELRGGFISRAGLLQGTSKRVDPNKQKGEAVTKKQRTVTGLTAERRSGTVSRMQ